MRQAKPRAVKKPKSPKTPKPPVWSFTATARCSVAIRELLRVREKQAILNKQAKLLQEMIVKEGGGQAHGVRAAVRHQRAGSATRHVTWKARDYVSFLPAVEGA